MLDLSLSTRKSPYFAKDQAKARRATKFIGHGSSRSSTDAYRRALHADVVNCGHYSSTDAVFISVEGARGGRIGADFNEIGKALRAGAIIITDGPEDRARSYNCGEREVAAFLLRNGYVEVGPGEWQSL